MSDERTGENERGFVVVDKRGREKEPEPREPEPREPEREPVRGAQELPPPDFASLLISLGTSALFHLGQAADPETGQQSEPNLPLARQTIDLVEMLRDKTRGNLDDEEQRLLQALLTDLRMRFVQASQKARA